MSREAFEAAFPAPRCCIWDADEQDYYLDGIQRPTRKEQLLALQHGFRWEGWEAALQAMQGDRPEECKNGCPEQQVCDWCQYNTPQPAVPEVDEVVFDMLKAAQGACKLGLKGYANTYIQNAIDLLSAGKGEQNDV
jgi:hypothetical protein